MKVKTKKDYIASLKDQEVVIYYKGERVGDRTTHPAFVPHINSAAKTYELALQPEHEDLLTATSHITGNKINRFTHIHQSVDDLIKKVQMLRVIAHETASCFQRCVGFDALNSLYITTFEIDEKHGTDYFTRFRNYLEKIQEENFMLVGGMTDPKGDRSKRPSQQVDPDLFTHVVEKRDEGIVIRGAKAHQTGAVNSHEIMIVPTQNMMEGDEEYAVAAAIPLSAKGVTMIFGRQTNEERKLECGIDAGNSEFGMVGGEALVVFDDVFVPWERVFMCGEIDFTGVLVERFATLHRQNYGGCKGGVSDIVIGASALAAQYQGTLNASHIKDKLVEMLHLAETVYAGSVACSAMGSKTKSGAYYPDPLLANCTKQNITRFIYEISRLAHDIGGGILATLPFDTDLKHPEIGKYVEKYLKGVEGVSTETRIKVLRLLENMTGGTALIESMHGAGSPQSQRVMYQRLGKLGEKMKMAKKVAKADE
ncbi:4-hydroxyphenylacetate 3-hydroxylase family protein [Desulfomonile tiedjei]|uniref:Aromatic ring hydroxylase n=1 Tax=Desulfomonile tiedjei (strain ATCC 49306 / DSM 6799 / DCB-1) TaxID=706587 RepID=I4C1U2_DESTA|nr:4-hydroxyphenylacetate 3-hydroxylase family protein [Desulfomonile tiedjei]AFM23533.1 aromatic ring hydroxylase [Desulfomonile tiedjei DSM 6799]